MRLLIGSLIQESNTFSPLSTDIDMFRAGVLAEGSDGIESAARGTELAGIRDTCRAAGAHVIGSLSAWASSGGPLRRDDFETLSELLIKPIENRDDIDGVVLALHGSLVVDEIPDADGELLRRARRAAGPSVPIVCTLDLHANSTTQMAASADALVGYETYPHVDMYETGQRGAELAIDLVRRGRRAQTLIRKIPMIIPPENASTFDGPLTAVVDEVAGLRSHRDVLSASLLTVQPWLDVPELGCAVVVVVDEALSPTALTGITAEVDRIAAMLWERRHAFAVELNTPPEAVRRAFSSGTEPPVLLVDSADSVSSGAPGDGTAVLRALLDAAPQRPAYVTLTDPVAARQAYDADGKLVRLRAGGNLDPTRNQPVELVGIARRVLTEHVTFSAGVGDGLTAHLGRAAVVTVGNVHVLLMERPVNCWDPQLYRLAGLEPTQAHAVVVKSPHNFRHTFRDIATNWLYVDAPGSSTPRLGNLEFHNAPRPLFPLDEFSWTPE